LSQDDKFADSYAVVSDARVVFAFVLVSIVDELADGVESDAALLELVLELEVPLDEPDAVWRNV
jgi:hypothetical protein